MNTSVKYVLAFLLAALLMTQVVSYAEDWRNGSSEKTLYSEEAYDQAFERELAGAGAYTITLNLNGGIAETSDGKTFSLYSFSISPGQRADQADITDELIRTSWTLRYSGSDMVLQGWSTDSLSMAGVPLSALVPEGDTTYYAIWEKDSGTSQGTQRSESSHTVYTLDEKDVTGVVDKVYTGKPVIQKLVVSYQGKTLKEDRDYTVTYKNNINVGTASVVVTGQGDYNGKVTKSFLINPEAVKPVSVTAGKGQITVRMPKVGKSVKKKTYYQIKMKPVSGTSSKTPIKAVVSAAKSTKYVKKSLKAGATYKVSVRVIRTVKKKKYYSGWTKAVKVTVK